MLQMLGILLGEQIDGNKYVALIVAAIAGVLLMASTRRRQQKRAKASVFPNFQKLQSPPGTKAADDTQTKEKLRRDLENLIGELQDLSRKISAEIDTRFAKLEAAIHDADRRIAVLNRLAREAGEKGREQPVNEPEDHDTRYALVYELADEGFSSVEIAKDLGKTPGEIELILNLRRTAQR